MSTLEKSIQLLNTLPEHDVEIIYAFIQFINSQHTTKTTNNENIDSILNNLIGSIPDTGKTLEEYKSERIQTRYESTD